MASRPQVPKFGNWENVDDVPYTVYFEKAKNARKGKANPETPGSSSINGLAVQAGEEVEVKNGDLTKSEASKTLDRRVSEEEVDLRKSRDSPTHHKRTSRQSVGSDRSFDNSPMHPHNQAKIGNRGSASSSPISERKTSLEGNHGAASSNPGRSRLKQVTRGDENPDDGTVIPKFGGWNDSDPTSGEAYTGIFDKAREDKHNGGGKSPMITTESANFYGQNRHSNDDSKCCGCFPWSRK